MPTWSMRLFRFAQLAVVLDEDDLGPRVARGGKELRDVSEDAIDLEGPVCDGGFLDINDDKGGATALEGIRGDQWGGRT